ncbi:hypothetical protein EIP91_011788 [Steccherinum ochraceum]|uniref:FAD/NAD(P)-binding domain-containing protein n=1 Tax=Steccherinum ochraceum TaxID=92696 RepID=A0A4R0RXZ6_9APHY|nr:hypothetical protein EIP91_011788 [Steccherinum ochraceum]
MASDKDVPLEPRVVIIGGGIAGIMTAIALKKRLGFHNFTIYEQADDLGGTWTLNTYPGCACDIATHFYSYSAELNPEWDHSHVYQPELKAYWRGIAEKYDVVHHICLRTTVLGADWNAQRQIYRAEVLDLQTGKKRVEIANVVISATGFLREPNFAENLRGVRETFKGEHFHSARWDYGVDLHNKRVAVIGNGSSASQFIPIITKDPTTHVTCFYGAPKWIIPEASAKAATIPANIRWRIPIPLWQRKMFRYVPLTLWMYRWMLIIGYEYFYTAIMSGPPNHKGRESLMEAIRKYIRETAPEEYHDKLMPDYPFGCKRFIVDSGHLAALYRPNNDANFNGIAEVTENGIVTKKDERLDFDVIIEATGYIVDKYHIKIRGSDGTTIQDYFKEKEGPTAYKGTAVPNFPNFFMICGPNAPVTHGAVIFTEELQVNYIIQLLGPILSKQVSSFEVTHAAADEWNAFTQQKLGISVWSACHSWYRVGTTGKNSIIWPGALIHQWWNLRKPDWKHYIAVGASEWESRRFWGRIWQLLAALVVLAVFGWVWVHPVDFAGVLALLNAQVTLLKAMTLSYSGPSTVV